MNQFDTDLKTLIDSIRREIALECAEDDPISANHIVSAYSEELIALAHAIDKMGEHVEASIENSVRALLILDRQLANQIIIADRRIDDMQRRIDDMAVSIIARRQPMASDLRAIVTAIHIASDLERVGDMTKQLARRSLKLEGLTLPPDFYNGVKNMATLVQLQIKEALDAYSNRASTAAAIDVCNRDDAVDTLHVSLYRDLLSYMQEDPRSIPACTQLLFCTKSLERIGDHATNIAEHAYYLQTGKQLTSNAQNLHRTQVKE